MKNKIISGLLLLAFVVGQYSCKEDEFSQGTQVSLTSQEEVNSFNYPREIDVLKISGEGITDLSAVSVQVVNTLIVENTGITNVDLPNLSAVRVALVVKDNPALTRFTEVPSLKFLGGSVEFDNNDNLEDISGFDSFEFVKGELIIRNNDKLGEDKDCAIEEGSFCGLLNLYNAGVLEGKVTLSNNHPSSVSDVSMIGSIARQSGYIDYVLTSQAAIDQFTPAKDTIGNLTIRGIDIGYIGSIAQKVKVVKGTITIQNTSVPTTEGFFDDVRADSSVYLLDNPELNNPNGFKNTTRINGDLVVDNCPKLPFAWAPDAFTKIDSVYGDLIIRDCPQFISGAIGLQSLVYVAGDFEISGSGGDLWNLGSMNPGIKYIGGDLTFSGNQVVNSLDGFQNLEYLGGDSITIVDNGGIPNYSGDDGPGFCLLREKWAEGKIAASVIQLKRSGEENYIDFNALQMCDGSDVPQFTSYSLSSQGEVDTFQPANDTIQDLIIEGGSIDYIGSIAEKVKVVMGDVRIENTALTTTENFFELIEFKGNIELRNNASLNNPNGFKHMEVIHGDLVLENLPQMPFNWAPDALTKIDSVYGSVVVKDCPQFIDGGIGLQSLVYVGGDFHVENSGSEGNKLWNFTTMNPGLDYIGGNLIIKYNPFVNSLGGLDQLSFIGGDRIEIVENGWIANETNGNGPGMCRIREYYDDGVIQNDEVVIVLKRSNEDAVDFESLVRCN